MKFIVNRNTEILILLCFIFAIVGFVIVWQFYFDKHGYVVSYFGYPKDILNFCLNRWDTVVKGTITTLTIALGSLVVSAILALLCLTIGLLSEKNLQIIERVSVISQTIPMFVIATTTYIIFRYIGKYVNIQLNFILYCIPPVTLALFFPPVIYGAKAVRDIDFELKALLRVWNPPQIWRIKRIYLPIAIPHILTGVKVSSTWAVVASLITEGLMFSVGGDNYSMGKTLIKPFSVHTKGMAITFIFIATILGFLVFTFFEWLQHKIEKKLLGIAFHKERSYPIQ